MQFQVYLTVENLANPVLVGALFWLKTSILVRFPHLCMNQVTSAELTSCGKSQKYTQVFQSILILFPFCFLLILQVSLNPTLLSSTIPSLPPDNYLFFILTSQPLPLNGFQILFIMIYSGWGIYNGIVWMANRYLSFRFDGFIYAMFMKWLQLYLGVKNGSKRQNERPDEDMWYFGHMLYDNFDTNAERLHFTLTLHSSMLSQAIIYKGHQFVSKISIFLSLHFYKRLSISLKSNQLNYFLYQFLSLSPYVS